MGRLSLVSCSDPVQPPPAGRLGELVSALAAAGYDPDAEAIRELGADGWRRDPRRRAGMLNRAFADPGVEAVVDVSGGDLANEVLSYLDWGTIAANPKPVVGYSDLTCVLNAIVARTGRTAVLWNAMAGLHRGFGVLDAALAGETIRPALAGADGDADAFEALPWLGGNLRCFLKLAGTRYWPDLAGGVLLVESLGASLKALAAGLDGAASRQGQDEVLVLTGGHGQGLPRSERHHAQGGPLPAGPLRGEVQLVAVVGELAGADDVAGLVRRLGLGGAVGVAHGGAPSAPGGTRGDCLVWGGPAGAD